MFHDSSWMLIIVCCNLSQIATGKRPQLYATRLLLVLFLILSLPKYLCHYLLIYQQLLFYLNFSSFLLPFSPSFLSSFLPFFSAIFHSLVHFISPCNSQVQPGNHRKPGTQFGNWVSGTKVLIPSSDSSQFVRQQEIVL